MSFASFRLAVLAGLLAVPAPGFGQLMRVVGEGSLEHLDNPGQTPAFLPGYAVVTFDFRLPAIPAAAGLLETWVPASARLDVGAHRFALENAAFEVSRVPGLEPLTSYVMRGETAEGWRFFLENAFQSDGVEEGFPARIPPAAELLRHDVTLVDGGGRWGAYGDGVITSIVFVAAPEPASYAVAGLGLLGGVVLVRRWRELVASRRRGAPRA